MKLYNKNSVTKKRRHINVKHKRVNPHLGYKAGIASTDVQVNAIIVSLKQNYLFYITLIVCILLINKYSYKSSNLLLSILTIIPISLFGFSIHYASHFMKNKLSKNYSTINNIFTRNVVCDSVLKYIIRVSEFHDSVHHDTCINKKYTNIGLEFMNNLLIQGVLVIIIKQFLNFMDNKIIVLWALFYSTVHNINFNITHPITHAEHHINNRTNYGIDIWDILLGSKYDWTHIDNHNDTVINLIVITIVIIYISRYLKL